MTNPLSDLEVLVLARCLERCHSIDELSQACAGIEDVSLPAIQTFLARFPSYEEARHAVLTRIEALGGMDTLESIDRAFSTSDFLAGADSESPHHDTPRTLPEIFDDYRLTNEFTIDPCFREYMEVRDGFVPKVVAECLQRDVATLLALASRVQKQAAKVSYYSFYVSIIEKAALLALERWPAAFQALDQSERDRIIGTKISFPNERAVYDQIYAYTCSRVPLPFATFFTGVTFRQMLDRCIDAEPERFDARLKKILLVLDAEYIHFLGCGAGE